MNVDGISGNMEVQGVVEEGKLFGSSFLTVAVAVNGSRTSKYAVKWALEKFVPEGRILYKLIYVRPRITMIPTPMGNLPISKVREDVLAAYKKEMNWKTNAMLFPYKQMCAERHVQEEVVIIESDEIADAISQEITKCAIDKLVIGTSSHHVLTRDLQDQITEGRDIWSYLGLVIFSGIENQTTRVFERKHRSGRLSCKISASAPSFCTVYVVSKGKLSSVRTSTSGVGGSVMDDRSNSSMDSRSLSSETSCSLSEWTETDAEPSTSHSHSYCPLALQRDQALKALNQRLQTKPSTINTTSSQTISSDAPLHKHLSLDSGEESHSSSLDMQSGVPASGSIDFQMHKQVPLSVHPPMSENMMDSSSFSDNEVDVTFELDKLRIELRHYKGMYEIARNEENVALHELNELSQKYLEENQRLQEITSREQQAREHLREIKQKREAAGKEAEFVRFCVEREALARKDAERNAARSVEEKEKLEKALLGPDLQYRIFEWADILSATSSLSHALKIGGGANGTVYKANLHHMKVAIKVLHSVESHRTKQFKQELEVLGRVRHPHLLLLLGACPDHGCLVYEYMENGSLDDRLQQKKGEPVLRWFDRFRIAWEVASALVFLHNSKPKPIVHRDLKPANILLDHNLVSKIGDVGLSTLLPSSNNAMSTVFKDTAPVGTFCYIDPEYQRTGILSPKSDVYALGMVILQLLTAKSPMGLTHTVEMAFESGRLMDVLDSAAGKWPLEETQELTLLGLRCAELRRGDRPELQGQVLPMLERLRIFADNARNTVHQAPFAPPSHFICPILQEIMEEPCVAADGYTYDRRAIEIWLNMNDKSPLTNLLLPNKTLIPNHTLLSAIKEWKSSRDQ